MTIDDFPQEVIDNLLIARMEIWREDCIRITAEREAAARIAREQAEQEDAA